MNPQIKFLIDLFHKSVDKDYELIFNIDEIDFELIYKLAAKSRISNCLYYGLLTLDKDIQARIPNFNKFKNDCLIYGMKEKVQDDDIKDIIKALEKENIEMTFFKGYFLKNIYPSKDMRVMGDIDFLVDHKDVIRASKAIEEIGFKKDKDIDFNVELGFKRKSVVELHKKLSVAEYKYFDDALDHKEKYLDYSNTYVLEKNYHFIYLISHAYYHMIKGGLGMKYPMDFYLFLNKYPLDLTKIEEDLKSLNLLNFTKAILILINKWFDFDLKNYATFLGDYTLNEELETLEKFIIGGGEYGLNHDIYKAQKASRKNHFSYLLSKIFRPFRFVCKTDHPTLLNYLLLPFYYLRHWFNFLIVKGFKNIKKASSYLNSDESKELENLFKKIQ